MSPIQILSILWRRTWVIVLTFVSVMTGAGLLMLLVPPRYDAVATASIDPGQADPVTGEASGGTLLRILQGNLVALVKSQRVAVDVVKRLNLVNNPVLAAEYRSSPAAGHVDIAEWIADELLKSVDAKFGEGSNVLTITFKSFSPSLAAQAANTFMAAFADAAVEMKVTAAQQTARWFDPQLEKLRTDLAAASEKLAKFQRDTKLIAASAADSENARVVAVTEQIAAAKNELLSIQGQLHATAGGGSSDAQINDTPLLASLKSNLANAEETIGKLRNEVGANNPKLTAALAVRQSLQDQIKTEIANHREALGTRAKALENQIAFLEKARSEAVENLISVQAQRDQLAALKIEVEFRQEQLHRAMTAAGSARLEGQLSFSNISPLDKATAPVSPAFPKLTVVMLAGVGCGLALGIIFALLVEAFDRRIRFPSDLEFATAAPVLGTLRTNAPRRRLPLPILRGLGGTARMQEPSFPYPQVTSRGKPA